MASKTERRPVKERGVVTPQPDLFVIKIGDRSGKVRVSSTEQAAGLLEKLAKAIAKPGADRSKVFQSGSGRPVYAYFLEASDPAKMIREDASGRQTVGRFAGGRFRAIRSSRTI